MASPYPIPNRYRVTPADDGKILKLGNAASGEVGTWLVQFVPDMTFAGDLVVMGRVDHAEAQTDNVPYVPVRYRAAYLNTASADYALVETAVVSGSILQIPASGLSIALLASCTAGYGYLYATPLGGPSVV
jgi:hypothetical protein